MAEIEVNQESPEDIIRKLFLPLHNDLTGEYCNKGKAGENLKYDSVYVYIKEARKEEDPNLSQGIWQAPIKRADWKKVEDLATKALTKQTKDLQIAAWLAESWIAIDGLDGAIRGFMLLKGLCENLWEEVYPEIIKGNDESLVNRFNTINRIDYLLAEKIKFCHFVKNPPFVVSGGTERPGSNLADWQQAQALEVLARRSKEPKKILANAENSGNLTLRVFRKILELTPYEDLAQTAEKLEDLESKINDLVKLISEKFAGQEKKDNKILALEAPDFSKTLKNVRDICNIISSHLSTRQDFVKELVKSADIVNSEIENVLSTEIPEIPMDDENTEEKQAEKPSKEDAYRAIAEISQFLREEDPKSLVPPLLEVIFTWQEKSIVEVLQDVKEGKKEGHVLLRLLANQPSS